MANTQGLTIGVSWGDVDGDGDDDLVLGTTSSGPTYLFLNDGAGNFERQNDSLLDGNYPVWTPILGDYDNDGDQDMFLVSFGEPSRLLENVGGTTFVEQSSGGLFSDAGNLMARGGAWADYDGDGYLDLMVSTNAPKPSVGSDKLYRNVGDSTFLDETPTVFGDMSIGRGVIWSDFDNDGDIDLYAVGGKGCPCNWETQPDSWYTNAENRMFENIDGVLVNATTNVTVDINHGRGVTAGDYDNDGDMDLFICNIAVTGEEGSNPETIGGQNRLLRNDGNFVFTDVTPQALISTGNHRSSGWFDADNDGDLDLLVIAMNNAITTLFENINSGESFVAKDIKVFGSPLYQGISGGGCAFSDFDTDGDVDIFVTHKNGSNRFLRNDVSNGNHWLQIKLEGVESNRDGIGARVKITTPDGEQIRDVRTSTGYWSQNSLTQHFGLGTTTVVDRVDITWPSGTQQTIVAPEVDQVLRITECESVCSCEGDTNGDGEVNVLDIIQIIIDFNGGPDALGDVDGNGEVNTLDILLVVAAWGICQ